MLIACVVVLVWDCVKGAKTRRRNATIPTIAASVSFLVAANALVDFSLQIQAVTLTFMAVLGAGVAQAREDDLPKVQGSARHALVVSKCRRIPDECRISASHQVSAEPAERGFDLRNYFNFVWRHWMFIGAFAALGARRGPHLPGARDATLHGKYPSSARAAARKGARRHQFRCKYLGLCFRIENQLAILKSDSLLRRVAVKHLVASCRRPKILRQRR